ncbi:hypothetical protein TI39_contig289g00008 [Zymoseptoria brevis]|uniref:Uncharacterized protein n=1 Tax=Zymoseptoria brevis TaxID=1047168 RepID=A0A0F4GWT4_9PEZI|nr:hypothetical protein TI39_contig289g00008 [Zymoseptoria brevis]
MSSRSTRLRLQAARNNDFVAALKIGWSVPRLLRIYNNNRIAKGMAPVDEIDDAELLEMIQKRKSGQRRNQRRYQRRLRAQASDGSEGSQERLREDQTEQDDTDERDTEADSDEDNYLGRRNSGPPGFLNHSVMRPLPGRPAVQIQSQQRPQTYPMPPPRNEAQAYYADLLQRWHPQPRTHQGVMGYFSGLMAFFRPSQDQNGEARGMAENAGGQ